MTRMELVSVLSTTYFFLSLNIYLGLFELKEHLNPLISLVALTGWKTEINVNHSVQGIYIKDNGLKTSVVR